MSNELDELEFDEGDYGEGYPWSISRDVEIEETDKPCRHCRPPTPAEQARYEERTRKIYGSDYPWPHKLVGIVLTHGHEDHLGAIQYLWPRLRCPVWATPFTASLLKSKLHETGLHTQVPVNVVELGSRFAVGPFDIEMISVTHSIPEPNNLAIRTKAGTVIHTGDWKFDPDPLLGLPVSIRMGSMKQITIHCLPRTNISSLVFMPTHGLFIA